MERHGKSHAFVMHRAFLQTEHAGEEAHGEPGHGTRQIIGAGRFIPDTDQVADEIAGAQVCIDPKGQGVANTNNRAELVAIAVALQRKCTTIATDSLVCLRWIRKAVLRPWLLSNHVHGPLLKHVVQLIINAPCKVTLHKVISHYGIVGNVMADRCADRAVNVVRLASGTDETFPLFNDPFADKTWLKVQEPLPEGSRITTPAGWALRDMKGDLKQLVTQTHRMGDSNVDSVYYKSWQELTGKVDVLASNHFMKSGAAVTGRERTRLLQIRTGTLPHQGNLHKWGLAPSGMCLHCGGQDSGFHAVSGCPVIARTVALNRHHCAGRYILQAVRDGDKGANVMMADVGRRELMEAAGLDDVAWKIPSWMFRPEWVADDQRIARWHQQLRPDVLMLMNPAGQDRHRITPASKIYIVEVKYCRDTNPEQQEQNAHAQHVKLRRLLELMWGCHVEIVPLILGVCGTITLNVKETLEKLGVKGNLYKQLANKLNVSAAVYADRAWQYRLLHMPGGQRGQGGWSGNRGGRGFNNARGRGRHK